MDFEQIDDWLAAHVEEMIELQAGLTARPALGPENGGAGEWEKARFLERYLRDCGLEGIEHYDCPDERVPEGTRPNFALTVAGASDGPPCWVLSHMDVVPPGQQLPDGSWRGWQSDPYHVRREGDLIVGRGVTDDQQAIVASVFAVRALLENGVTPARAVKLLFVSDEETGSARGLGHVVSEHGELFSPEDVIIVPDAGFEDSTMIEVAEKSVLWLEFRVGGRQAHASRPEKAVNAFRVASRLVGLLDDELAARFDAADPLYDPPRSTFEPTLHEANVPNVNTIPGEDVFCVDCRVLPCYGLDDVIERVRAVCREVDSNMGTVTEVLVRNCQDAAPPTDADAPVVRMLRSAVEQVYGVKARAMGIGGQTVASVFRAAGLPAAVWMTTTETAHQANESCAIAHMVGDAGVFARVFMAEP